MLGRHVMSTDEILRYVVIAIFMSVTIYALTHPDVFLD